MPSAPQVVVGPASTYVGPASTGPASTAGRPGSQPPPLQVKPVRQSVSEAQADSQKAVPVPPTRSPHTVPEPQETAGMDELHVREVQYPPGAINPEAVASCWEKHVAVPSMGSQSELVSHGPPTGDCAGAGPASYGSPASRTVPAS